MADAGFSLPLALGRGNTAQPVQSPEDVARALVTNGVAPDAAVGFAVRTASGWELEAGRASTGSAGEIEPIFDLASLTKPLTVLAFVRSQGSERVLVAHNLGDEPRTLVVEVEGTSVKPLLAAEGVSATREGGAVRLSLPPFSSAAFQL